MPAAFNLGEIPAASVLSSSALAETSDSSGEAPRHSPISLGLLTYCFELARKARPEVPGVPDYGNAVVFIQEAARIGATSVQLAFGVCNAEAVRAIRETSDRLGVALEATLALPQADSDVAKFEAELRSARELGISIARTVVFPGRRYEDLKSYSAYQSAVAAARDRLKRAEPIARRNQLRLAVENHKDQRMPERLKLLEEFSSEYVGACVDVGNNISLLEDPVEVAQALAPWALTVHFKDQGVREYEEGFLLADVPLGKGCIELAKVTKTIRDKKPGARFLLELITRDPLKVPVLNDGYWGSSPDVTARQLSHGWRFIKEHAATEPFPMPSKLSAAEKVALERRNIEESFQFAATKLDFRI